MSVLDLLPNGGGDGGAFEFLRLDNMRKFNEETPDVPGVAYFSWGAVYEPALVDTWKCVFVYSLRYVYTNILEKMASWSNPCSGRPERWPRLRFVF